jgi:ATP-dependent DNA helicase RecQ
MSINYPSYLRAIYGNHASFRDGQLGAIQAIVEHKQRILVVQKTGWGKSLVYFLATKILREQGKGCTVLVSPLLALMRNQLLAARNIGLKANTLNSTNPDEHAEIEHALLSNQLDLILISPERLGNNHFRQKVWNKLSSKIGLLVIDEVHCISDWGHDFRPDYRRIIHILQEIPTKTPIIGTTATANDRVIEDVESILGTMQTLRGSLYRESLRLFVYREVRSISYRLNLLLHLLNRVSGSGIIYCLTTRDCLRVAEWLQKNGISAKPYYSGVEGDTGTDREDLETQLLNNEIRVLVASVALGMGFDKPDLSFVIHYQKPNSIVSYYQQIGRAGRGIDKAFIVLMHGEEDNDIHQHFIATAFPSEQDIRHAMQILQREPTTKQYLQNELNVNRTSIDKILNHLEIEKAIVYENEGFRWVGHRLPDFDRWASVQHQRQVELAQVDEYIQHENCLMQFLAQALNDHTQVKPCGKCMNCIQWKNQYQPTPEQIQQTQHFLQGGKPIAIEPRKSWVNRRSAPESKAKLSTKNQTGYALSYYRDDGWGQMVYEGKYIHKRFSDELVVASAQFIQEHLKKIKWLTCVASARHPQLVNDFTQRLAQYLYLPFYPIVQPSQNRPEQKTMLNSHQQQNNSLKAFQIDAKIRHPKTPVLLVDDIVNSGWTLTSVGWQLRKVGIEDVYPFVLAKA